jgi:hypothetical protein
MADPRTPVQELTADQFVALVFAATDEQIEEGIRAAGTAQVLDRIFAEMGRRFLPERAPGLEAEIQWIVTDGAESTPTGWPSVRAGARPGGAGRRGRRRP